MGWLEPVCPCPCWVAGYLSGDQFSATDQARFEQGIVCQKSLEPEMDLKHRRIDVAGGAGLQHVCMWASRDGSSIHALDVYTTCEPLPLLPLAAPYLGKHMVDFML